MPSKKDFKKDINFLVDEVIGTCMVHKTVVKEKSDIDLDAIIEEMLMFREDILARVNNPELSETHKTIRSYYNALNEELLQHVNEVFDKLHADTE